MARTKQTARRTTGNYAPRHLLPEGRPPPDADVVRVPVPTPKRKRADGSPSAKRRKTAAPPCEVAPPPPPRPVAEEPKRRVMSYQEFRQLGFDIEKLSPAHGEKVCDVIREAGEWTGLETVDEIHIDLRSLSAGTCQAVRKYVYNVMRGEKKPAAPASAT